MTLSAIPQSSEYQLVGNFETSLELDNVDPVKASVMAAVSSTGGATTLHFKGSTSSDIAIPGLSCFIIKPMNLSASFSLKPQFKVDALTLTGGASGCGFGSADASFTYNDSRNVTVFNMTIKPELPSPFAAGSSAIMTIDKQGTTSGLMASFASSITLPVLEKPLDLSLGIFVSQDAQTTKMHLSGNITSPVTFSLIPAFSIKSLKLFGALTVTPSPVTVTALNLTGDFLVASLAATGTFLYDPASKGVGLFVTLPSLGLQARGFV